MFIFYTKLRRYFQLIDEFFDLNDKKMLIVTKYLFSLASLPPIILLYIQYEIFNLCQIKMKN